MPARKSTKKAAPKKATPKKGVTEKVIAKKAAPVRRGQPTAAARLVSSSYVKFGWHKPLSGETKETVQSIGSLADAMYMMQIDRDRPVDSLSLRNAIFWEHRQLARPSIISTPALDHLDLFPTDEAAFHENYAKMRAQLQESKDDEDGEDGNTTWSLHYVFETIRQREFLLLPVEIDGSWLTIVCRLRDRKPKPDDEFHADREVADWLMFDPQADWEPRMHTAASRLIAFLRAGCIDMNEKTRIRQGNFGAPDQVEKQHSGLVAYAFAREFLRRMKVLTFLRDRKGRVSPTEMSRVVWGEFQEDYDLDAYRQSLMAACAHQCIEKSGYRVRMALEVPSSESNYDPALLERPESDEPERNVPDERWDSFQEPSHTLTITVPKDHNPPLQVCPEPPPLDLSALEPATPATPASTAHPLGDEGEDGLSVTTPTDPAPHASHANLAHAQAAGVYAGEPLPMATTGHIIMPSVESGVASTFPPPPPSEHAVYDNMHVSNNNDADADAESDNIAYYDHNTMQQQQHAPMPHMGNPLSPPASATSSSFSPPSGVMIPGLDIINHQAQAQAQVIIPTSPTLKRKVDTIHVYTSGGEGEEEDEQHTQKKKMRV
ncbi:hypothetical protein F5Y17DRAFT_385097 [Xylariaceae sp. FL0594]|nr:hypothetical protein F5Y17DRAFT_385097 [Xylariaceae sp. FL0594]